jgi:hypothetical protein
MSPLRRRMIEDMQIRNLTPNTQRVYSANVFRFACHFRKSPDRLGPPEIRSYLLHLTRERRLAASSIIVTVSALRFFYTITLKRDWVVEDDIPAGHQAKKLPGPAWNDAARTGRSIRRLPGSFRGAYRAIIARMSTLPHRPHGGDRHHRSMFRPSERQAPAGPGCEHSRRDGHRRAGAGAKWPTPGRAD